MLFPSWEELSIFQSLPIHYRYAELLSYALLFLALPLGPSWRLGAIPRTLPSDDAPISCLEQEEVAQVIFN